MFNVEFPDYITKICTRLSILLVCGIKQASQLYRLNKSYVRLSSCWIFSSPCTLEHEFYRIFFAPHFPMANECNAHKT